MKIGEKVRVKKVDYYEFEASEGAEGEVTLTNLAGRRPIGVRLTKKSPRAPSTPLSLIYHYREEDLELIEEAKPVAKFAVGDRVCINRWGIDNAREMCYEGHGLVEGMTGVVTYGGIDGNLDVTWDHPNNAKVTCVRQLAVDLIVGAEVPTASTVTRFVGAETDDLRFERQDDKVTLYSPDGEVLTSLTMTQLREVVAWLDDKGVAQ